MTLTTVRRSLLAATLLVSVGACASPEDAGDDEPASASADALGTCAASKNIQWKLHMKEDFDAWNDARFTKFDDHVPPGTSTCLSADNVTVGNGMLRIAAKKEARCQGQPYTGGAIQSYGKVWTGKYFKAEVRAKVSQEQGIFAAPLWFRPGTAQGAGGVGGEIDLVEVLGAGTRAKFAPPNFHTTLHSDYAIGKNVTHKTDFGAGDDGRQFHVYTVEKTPNGITFYFDGRFVAGWGCGDSGNERRPAWFASSFEESPEGWSIRIDNKVGGAWAGEPDRTTMWATAPRSTSIT
jgi:beta-glucanase (GH16 family)